MDAFAEMLAKQARLWESIKCSAPIEIIDVPDTGAFIVIDQPDRLDHVIAKAAN